MGLGRHIQGYREGVRVYCVLHSILFDRASFVGGGIVEERLGWYSVPRYC